ncbi:hypothetical protein KSF_064350 [Reticulibacter mediterranei]|uniref:Uncharacterized protein n=1 Tax=Reticulibacter mediterranei TaxID=2778369 RepID=A0A8J3IT85_9CHLR|nr:hypothetical protein KSF_064350 [Reticulibacter mediterranei]
MDFSHCYHINAMLFAKVLHIRNMLEKVRVDLLILERQIGLDIIVKFYNLEL